MNKLDFSKLDDATRQRVAITASLSSVAVALCVVFLSMSLVLRADDEAAAEVPAGEQIAPEAATIGDFAWLEGSWMTSERPGQIREEIWSAPRGGTIVGTGRTVRGDRTTFIEYLAIEQAEDGIHYRVLMGHRNPQPASFALIDAGDGFAVFEDPENDMPRKITYKLVDLADDAAEGMRKMTVILEGESNGRAIYYPIQFLTSSPEAEAAFEKMHAAAAEARAKAQAEAEAQAAAAPSTESEGAL